MRISVLGLGSMGAPIARNLAEVGHEVTVYHRTQEQSSGLSIKGIRVAATVAEAVRDAQVALTMVSGDETENSLTFGKGGLLASMYQGAIHLCMSTIGVEISRKLAAAHAEAGQGYVAAPVFGRPSDASARHLWIVVGGPEVQVVRCLTIFDALGRGITRVGTQAELAHALVLGGNLLSVLMVEGLAEVLAYGEKAGMPPGEYLRMLNTAIFRSPMVDACGGLIVRHAYDTPDLRLDSALSDVSLTMQASEKLNAVMPLAELLRRRLEAAAAQGWGAKDLTVLSRWCRLAAGLDQPDETAAPPLEGQLSKFTAWSPEGSAELDIRQVTHFESVQDEVWAWISGKRYTTGWKHLAEVERAFGHVPFLRLDRHILLKRDAVKALRATGAAAANPEEEADLEAPAFKNRLSVHVPEDDEKREVLELRMITHFEQENGAVWAWVKGERRQTFCRTLGEIEAIFRQFVFLKVTHNILLNPEAITSLSPLFGGRAKVKVEGDLEFILDRATTRRLRDLLG